ncbi:MAG: diacylglycerol kinase [Pirellulales bacterium]|nr:diacylglycerol kinase [Pirellulales bacterium]
MPEARTRTPRSWRLKFRDSLRGTRRGIRRESNFTIHLFTAALVIAAGAIFEIGLVEWCLVLLAIAVVLVTELLNTSIELLVKSLNTRHDPQIGEALDIAAGAVLVASFGAALVGGIVFVHRLGILLDWWKSVL